MRLAPAYLAFGVILGLSINAYAVPVAVLAFQSLTTRRVPAETHKILSRPLPRQRHTVTISFPTPATIHYTTEYEGQELPVPKKSKPTSQSDIHFAQSLVETYGRTDYPEDVFELNFDNSHPYENLGTGFVSYKAEVEFSPLEANAVGEEGEDICSPCFGTIFRDAELKVETILWPLENPERESYLYPRNAHPFLQLV
ncbi:hypothetical protein J3R30DRAFT_3409914 [Lentinula aciculospora]|uniref:Uncharacterized protein n=1 Tax=Lentinula aciculospora TaxID=153920 RepID=A0A9W9DG77_9AGAR|nr:hypothetical protein J3R30DRAFT_3409914 [Lentinula aciculospora]